MPLLTDVQREVLEELLLLSRAAHIVNVVDFSENEKYDNLTAASNKLDKYVGLAVNRVIEEFGS